ncbi:MAG: insulinase family protein [Deltaproteobacteria bacterium]|nr:insulinase family protein [Deltaproteobacteria bacterium]
MKFRVLLCASLAAAAALVSSIALAQRPLPALPVQTYALGNGLNVILHEDHTTPVVAVDVWYHVGSKDEPAGRNGFAHLFEHLMFQGSKHVGEDQFFQFLERAGASDRNGTTSTDRTNYFETVPSNRLELALWLESDRMGFLLDHVDQKTFEEQRKVVKNEKRQNYDDAPYGHVSQFQHDALYPTSHPYHNLTIGSYEDLDRATLDDVRKFFQTFYLPNNASLVVAGDIDPQKTRALIDKYFGTIHRGPMPQVITQAPAVELKGETTLQIDAGVELGRVYITWPTPAAYKPGDAALDLAANVLTQGKSSRLFKRLVYDLQIAKDVSAYQASAQLASTFEISATAKKGHTPEELLKVIDEELGKLRAQAPSDAETERAKTSFETDLIFGLERMGSRADLLNHYHQVTGDPGYFPKNIERYRVLRSADVQRAVQSFLPEHKRVVAIVRPDPKAPACGVLKGGR